MNGKRNEWTETQPIYSHVVLRGNVKHPYTRDERSVLIVVAIHKSFDNHVNYQKCNESRGSMAVWIRSRVFSNSNWMIIQFWDKWEVSVTVSMIYAKQIVWFHLVVTGCNWKGLRRQSWCNICHSRACCRTFLIPIINHFIIDDVLMILLWRCSITESYNFLW